MLFFCTVSVGGFIKCVFLFSLGAFIHDYLLKSPFMAFFSFLGMHFKSSLKKFGHHIEQGL
jgi:hypothetical protein